LIKIKKKNKKKNEKIEFERVNVWAFGSLCCLLACCLQFNLTKLVRTCQQKSFKWQFIVNY